MQFQESSPPNFCSCLIHQAHLPNKLGNYIFKHTLILRLFNFASDSKTDLSHAVSRVFTPKFP